MKIKGEKYDKMKAAMKAVVESRGIRSIKRYYSELGETRMLWDIWWVAHDNLVFNNDHPRFKRQGWERVYPHDPTFHLYSDDVNDSHIETALKKIGKEIGLIE